MKKYAIRENDLFKGYEARFTDDEITAAPYNYTIVECDKVDCVYSDFKNNVFSIEKYNARKRAEANAPRIEELKGLLSSTDYKAIKYAEGELTAEEYAETKAQRIAWRAEINSLEA